MTIEERMELLANELSRVNHRNRRLIGCLAVGLAVAPAALFSAGCDVAGPEAADLCHVAPLNPELPSMPNPASVYCTRVGGSLRIETDPDGGQRGICTLSDGIEWEEWDLYCHECLDSYWCEFVN